MFNFIKKLLAQNGLLLSAPISLADCTVTRPYLLERAKIDMGGSAVIFAIPYHTASGEVTCRNISRYAVGYDYHRFVGLLADELLPVLHARFPNTRFAMFADHSPIDEREAAAKAGLGIIGQHGLLITEQYSSYVFIGEIVTDKPLPPELSQVAKPRFCENCGACRAVCPLVRGEIGDCLSALTQKKGELAPTEVKAMIQHNTVWGCDLCQEACPHTRSARKNGTLFSPLPFFGDSPLPLVTYDGICSMSDEEFSKRAYAWRGRDIILRNLAAVRGQDETTTEKSKNV